MQQTAIKKPPGDVNALDIKRLREQKNLAQRDLARLSGVSPSAIVQIEAGRTKPHGKTLARIMDVLAPQTVVNTSKEETSAAYVAKLEAQVERLQRQLDMALQALAGKLLGRELAAYTKQRQKLGVRLSTLPPIHIRGALQTS